MMAEKEEEGVGSGLSTLMRREHFHTNRIRTLKGQGRVCVCVYIIEDDEINLDLSLPYL